MRRKTKNYHIHMASIIALSMTIVGTANAQNNQKPLPSDEPPAIAAPRVTNHICESIVPSWKVPALEDPKSASAREIGCAVAAWQLKAKEDLSYLPFKNYESSYGRGWVKAAFYLGLEEYADTIEDDGLILRVRQYSFENGFELGDRPWHGDDQTVAAIYAAIAVRDKDPSLMNKSIKVFDEILAKNYTNSLEFTPRTNPERESDCQTRWCWADAIFMAPPSWALATKISGDPRYADYAAKETRAIIEYLKDPKTGLFFRDSRFFEARTPNGKNVFWSRGNGWVFAGLARFIDALPANHKERPFLIKTYQDLAATLIGLQKDNGYWPTSLADAEYLKNPETSGTAFFGFGLAWGLNNGLLKGAQFEKSRDLAWDAMRAATNSNGKVGWVQQIGKDPVATDSDSSQLYGVGGMLLFASEMVKLENDTKK